MMVGLRFNANFLTVPEHVEPPPPPTSWVPTGWTCSLAPDGVRNGYQHAPLLAEINPITLEPTGNTRPNLPGDPYYAPDVFSPTACPYLTKWVRNTYTCRTTYRAIGGFPDAAATFGDGFAITNTLKRVYLDNEETGITKNNTISNNPDYIEPEYRPDMCAVESVLLAANDDSNTNTSDRLLVDTDLFIYANEVLVWQGYSLQGFALKVPVGSTVRIEQHTNRFNNPWPPQGRALLSILQWMFDTSVQGNIYNNSVTTQPPTEGSTSTQLVQIFEFVTLGASYHITSLGWTPLTGWRTYSTNVVAPVAAIGNMYVAVRDNSYSNFLTSAKGIVNDDVSEYNVLDDNGTCSFEVHNNTGQTYQVQLAVTGGSTIGVMTVPPGGNTAIFNNVPKDNITITVS